MIHNDVCPHCGRRNFVLAEQVNDGNLTSRKVLTLQPGHLYHVVCLNCGTVVRTFIEDPSELLTLGEDVVEGEIELSQVIAEE